MKIVELKAENVKRLVAVEIRPDGNVVQITGKNGQGKTSVLDSIWWALGGGATIQAEPIRHGEKFAKIVLDLGELKVTRIFRKDKDGETTSQLFVERAGDDRKLTSPQAVLDEVLGRLTFDPLEFARMLPREQREVVQGFIPGYDFAAAELADSGDFEERTHANKRAKEARILATKIPLPPGVKIPAEKQDEQPLLNEIESADQHNRITQERGFNRDAALKKVADNRATAQKLLDEAKELEAQLEAAGPLPALIDVTEVMRKVAVMRSENDVFATAQRRKEHEAESEKLEAQANALTEKMAKRDEARRAAIAAAKMPTDGLSFEGDAVMLGGVPFEQASDAEKLRASVAVAMALNPKLRVVRIRDGSLMDSASMAVVAEMAEKNDCQVWIEKVDESGAVGFVIEEGRVADRATVA